MIRLFRVISCIVVLVLAAGSLPGQPIRKVLLIGIDGCRPDALVAANAPTLDSLMGTGTFTLHSKTIYPTWSGPGWSSMLTGVWYTKHGVTDNTFSGANFTAYPHFFNRVETFDASLFTASICQWAPVNDYIVDLADLIANPGSGLGVATAASNLLLTQDPDVVFLHFDDVDHEGHATGFSPTNALYLSAIEGVDAHIRSVLNALRARPDYANEDWLIFVSTDHGGTGNSHGGNTEEEKTIFMILSGGDLPVQELQPQTLSAPLSPSVSLDGLSQYGAANGLPEYDFGTNRNFTVECRVQTNGWTGDPAIVSNKNWNSGYNPGFVLAARSDGYGWKANIGDGTNRIDLDGGTINDGRLHHLVLSVDRAGFARIFQDGILVDSADASMLGNIDTNLLFAVGQDGTLTYSYFFSGIVDELRLWDTALDAATVGNWSCRSLSATHPNLSNLIGHWQFDDNSGTQASDASAVANPIVLTGSPLWLTISQPLECTIDTALPRMVDVVPTLLDFLCIPVQASWQLDGTSIAALCASTGVVAPPPVSATLALFPNPVDERLTVSMQDAAITSLRVFHVSGKEVQVPIMSEGDRKLVLDCSGLPTGIYYVVVSDGARFFRDRFIKY